MRAQGYTDSLNHPAEIDADGFAICLLALNGISLDQAGETVCPEEKKVDLKMHFTVISPQMGTLLGTLLGTAQAHG